MAIEFRKEAEALRDELVDRRRDFHRHPELGFQEVRTSRIVAEELGKLGLEVQTGVGKTGVVGILEGDKEGPTVLVRADMDALPITEENETDYISTTPGVMHACGHDGHTTIALGVAKLFSQHRDQLAGRIKFVFQPAEEGLGGAQAMIDDGVLGEPRPDVSLGLHLWNSEPLGMLGVADGPVMAGASIFDIRVVGHGGHGAKPSMARDPIVCAAQIVTALQTIVSRNIDELEQAVVTVTRMDAGTAYNIIPQDVTLRGTFRTFKPEVRALVEKRIAEIAEGIAVALGCRAEVRLEHGVDPVNNHPDVGARVRRAMSRVVDAKQLDTTHRTMGSEDVGLLMGDVPGMFFFLGSANKARGLDYDHHHPRFDFDEDALPMGVALMSAAVAEYLIPEG